METLRAERIERGEKGSNKLIRRKRGTAKPAAKFNRVMDFDIARGVSHFGRWRLRLDRRVVNPSLSYPTDQPTNRVHGTFHRK